MKRFLVLLTLCLFAASAFAANSVPVASKVLYVQGDIQDAYTHYLVLYDAGTTACNDTTYDSYVATNLTGDASYSVGTPTWAAVSTAAQLGVLSILDTDDTHTFTSTTAVTTADCVVIYADIDVNGVDPGDPAIYRSDVTEFSVGDGNDFDLTLSSGYLLSVD